MKYSWTFIKPSSENVFLKMMPLYLVVYVMTMLYSSQMASITTGPNRSNVDTALFADRV